MTVAVKKGDIIGERKRYPDSCSLVLKVMGGGEGFETILCCGHELTEEDPVAEIGPTKGRKKRMVPPGATLAERFTRHPADCE